MNLLDALAIPPKSVVALVGAGGKTTLMYAIAREVAPRTPVGLILMTTTTKIFRPGPEEAEAVLLSPKLDPLQRAIRRAARKDRRVVAARGRVLDPRYEEEKLEGLPAGWCRPLIEMDEVALLLVEADGSRRLPVKAPGEGEPLWPDPTHLAIAILGMGALGKPLTEEWAFRPEAVSRVTGLAPGAEMTPASFAQLLIHPQGVLRGCPEGARRVYFLNQCEEEILFARAVEIGYIMEKSLRDDAWSLLAGSARDLVAQVIVRR